MRQTKAISFEFFPPRDIAAQEKLVRTGKQLVAAKPEYVSVTFGAGGSTRSGTAAAVRIMQNLGFETRSEEHTSELQSRGHLVCRLLLEKKKTSLHVVATR